MVHHVSSGRYVAAHRPKHSCPPQSSSPAVHGEGSPGSPWEECAAVAYAEDIGRCRTGPLANSGQKLTSSRQNRRRGNHRRSHRPVLDFPRLLSTANVGGRGCRSPERWFADWPLEGTGFEPSVPLLRNMVVLLCCRGMTSLYPSSLTHQKSSG